MGLYQVSSQSEPARADWVGLGCATSLAQSRGHGNQGSEWSCGRAGQALVGAPIIITSAQRELGRLRSNAHPDDTARPNVRRGQLVLAGLTTAARLLRRAQLKRTGKGTLVLQAQPQPNGLFAASAPAWGRWTSRTNAKPCQSEEAAAPCRARPALRLLWHSRVVLGTRSGTGRGRTHRGQVAEKQAQGPTHPAYRAEIPAGASPAQEEAVAEDMQQADQGWLDPSQRTARRPLQYKWPA